MVTIDASLDELTGATIIITATTTDPLASRRPGRSKNWILACFDLNGET
jgi:hypothetical protein